MSNLRIASFHTHEGYWHEMAKTGHTFYFLTSREHPYRWSVQCRPKPENVHYVDVKDVDLKEFDLLLTQSVGQWLDSRAWPARRRLHLEHTAPKRRKPIPVTGCPLVFITEYSRTAWKATGKVIRHGFTPDEWWQNNGGAPAKPLGLTVVNQYKKRDWCCGYSLFEQTRVLLAKRHGMSTPFAVHGHENEDIPHSVGGSGSWDELRGWYRDYRFFFNTSTHSPVPMALLEAMMSGMPIVAFATCEIPHFIEDAVDGFLVRTPHEAANRIFQLDADADLRSRLGQAARQRAAIVCSSQRFIDEWNATLADAVA